MSSAATDRPHDHSWYEIRLSGRLEPRWSAWFDGLSVTAGPDGTTTLRGPIVDQAALHGLLQRSRDLGLPLISVASVAPIAQPDSGDRHADSTGAPS